MWWANRNLVQMQCSAGTAWQGRFTPESRAKSAILQPGCRARKN